VSNNAFDVLVVEDDVALREQAARLIGLWGYGVREAADVAGALAEMERAPADIIVTDLLLPDQPSYHLMQWAQTRHPAPPVLVMTAYASLESAIESLKLGAYDFLLKPITPHELEAALARAGVAVSLQRARNRAEHLRHIAEVALTLAHEINNPLAVIMGELQLQIEDLGQPVERATLEACLASVQRIADVVRKISALQEVAYQEYNGMRMIDLEGRRPAASHQSPAIEA
jgi:DNA-binding response OmpR family regulator